MGLDPAREKPFDRDELPLYRMFIGQDVLDVFDLLPGRTGPPAGPFDCKGYTIMQDGGCLTSVKRTTMSEECAACSTMRVRRCRPDNGVGEDLAGESDTRPDCLNTSVSVVSGRSTCSRLLRAYPHTLAHVTAQDTRRAVDELAYSAHCSFG